MTTLRPLPTFFTSLLFLSLTAQPACTPEVRQYGGNGGSGGSTSSSSSSTGMVCSQDAQCGASSECQLFACVNGNCSVTFSPMGTAVAVQEKGDCQSKVCNGQGIVVDAPDLSDPADDGNPCTLDACVGGQTQHGFLMAGTSCDGTRFCDGFGYCVDCLVASDCPNGACTQNTCVAPQCSDAVKNGTETDVDCGGPLCAACPVGFGCGANQDCKSQVCEGGKCVAPTCMDNVQNGQETYIDCGGPDCLPCKPGAPCNAGIDCLSKICLAKVCQDAACDDMVKNGSETDIDCGGGTCMKCFNGRACFVATDCKGGQCCPGPGPNDPGYCENAGAMCLAVARSEMTQ